MNWIKHMLQELRSIKSGKKEIREFALTVGIIYLAIISWAAFMKGKVALGFLLPALLKPLQKVWMGFSVIVGFFMSRLILSVLFYLVITPLSIITKLLGKDLLDERIDKHAATYWHDRDQAERPKESYENQY